MSQASLIFTITDKVGGLDDILAIVKKQNLNMTRIESRPSKTPQWDYDFFVDFANATPEQLDALTRQIKDIGAGVSAVETNGKQLLSPSNTSVTQIPWFPRKITDLDQLSQKILECGEELDSDHPGFHDQEYRDRRRFITSIARNYKHGQPIPKVEYTEDEKATWKTIYTNLSKLYPTHACKQFNYVLPLLERNCGYGPDNIPQLEEVSQYLLECTGWRLRPVAGLLTPRDFLNALAFRVFHSTQYIRHKSKPFYTPEPDICHELIGHVPLFADPDFADFSQEIGLASLGATDEDIDRLASMYWFTVEFGICKENGKLKAYGAGLLSSYGELEYCLGALEEKPQYEPFEPTITAEKKYPITIYQPLYYVADSFQDATRKIKEFAENHLQRDFAVSYNPYTHTVEILNNRHQLAHLVQRLQAQLATLNVAITKLPIK